MASLNPYKALQCAVRGICFLTQYPKLGTSKHFMKRVKAESNSPACTAAGSRSDDAWGLSEGCLQQLGLDFTGSFVPTTWPLSQADWQAGIRGLFMGPSKLLV